MAESEDGKKSVAKGKRAIRNKRQPKRAEATKADASKMDEQLLREKIDELKHSFHLAEESLSRLRDEVASIPDTENKGHRKALQAKIGSVEKLIEELKLQVNNAPEIAVALGLDTGLEKVKEKPEKNIVKETRFTPKNIKIESLKPVAQSFMTGVGPRDTKRLDGNTLREVRLLGKVRMIFSDEAGRPAPNAPYILMAQEKSSDARIPLRSGRTDANGYTSVNLSDVAVDNIERIEVQLSDSGESNKKPYVYELTDALLADIRIPETPLMIPVPKDLIEKIKDWRKNLGDVDNGGTIEDPDVVDVSISPGSFGLNEEHVDGNCCLRPRTEFAAKEYYFRQTLRLTDVEDVRLVFDNEKEKSRQSVSAPVDYGDESVSTYAVLGGNILIGLSNLYRHSWYPVGRGLGRLLYSTSLAPCEEINLAFIDWTRRERDSRSEARGQTERLEHELQNDRSIDEVVDATLREHQTGKSTSGGGGASLDLGFFSIGGGGGSTTSSTSGRRALHVSTTQNISDSIVQSASSIRQQRATVVTTSYQQESERIKTRTIHNHNMNHMMNLQYFQVVEHYAVKTELVEEKPVLLVPYEIDRDIFGKIESYEKFVSFPSQPITRFLDRHSRVLRRIVPRRYRRAFQSLARLLHCGDIYGIEEPYATFSRWDINLGSAWRKGVNLMIKTKSGQTVRLLPRGHSSSRPPTRFVSSPVRHDDIDEFVVSFDVSEAVRNTALNGIPTIIESILDDIVSYALNRLEVYATTDRSRFVSQPQSYVIETNSVDVVLSSANPSVSIGVASLPPVDFSNYRGREHQDYCRLKKLIAHIQANPMRYMRAIWLREDPDRRAIRFDQYKLGGKSLLDNIVNKPIGILGNYVAFELLDGHRLVALDSPDYVVSSRIVTIPTRGVFGEVFLSCCNATEKRDVERFVEPENRCQRNAPDITGVSPGSRASRSDTTPTDFSAPIVNLQNSPAQPAPSGMSNALSVLGTPDIFRDLSRGAELLSFINNATKEAFTSTRQHRAAMDAIAGDVIRGLVSAYTGVPIKSSGTPQTASSDTEGIVPTDSSGGGKAPDIKLPTSAKVNDPGLQALSSELVRQASPSRLNDHLQTIKNGVDSGLLSATQGNQLSNALLGGVDEQEMIIPASNVDYGIIAQPLGATKREVDIKLRVFIPAPAVSIRMPWLNAGIPFLSDYAGDNRGFGYSGGTSRAEIHATLTFGTDLSWPRLVLHTIEFDETRAYDQDDTVDVDDKPDWWKALKQGASPTASATLSRTDENLNIVPSYVAPLTAESYWPDGPIAVLVYMKVNGSNPLEDAAPAINADLYLYLKVYQGKIYFKLSGTHDGFPAYELYVDSCPVFRHDPVSEDQSPLSLFPPSEFTVGSVGIGDGWQELPCTLV